MTQQLLFSDPSRPICVISFTQKSCSFVHSLGPWSSWGLEGYYRMFQVKNGDSEMLFKELNQVGQWHKDYEMRQVTIYNTKVFSQKTKRLASVEISSDNWGA